MPLSSPLRSPAVANGLSSARKGLGSALQSPAVAATLSFLLPGLGQAALGKYRRAAFVALPALALLAALVGLLLFARKEVFGLAFNQQWLTSLLVLDLVTLIYHLWAMLDAYLLARKLHPVRVGAGASRWVGMAAVGVLVVGTVGIHAEVAAIDMAWQHDLNCFNSIIPCWVGQEAQAPGETIAMPSDEIDNGGDSGSPSDWIAGGAYVLDLSQSASPAPGTSPTPDFTPAPYVLGNLPDSDPTDNAAKWADDGKLVVLIVGVDQGAGGGRMSKNLRTDSMNLLQVDMATGKAAMYAIPRNTHCVPLPKESAVFYKGTSSCPKYSYPGMLNSLPLEAYNKPKNFPYYQGPKEYYMRQIVALERAVGTLTGLHVDGTALVTLMGFVQLIDDMGGIDINVPSRLHDNPCGPKGTPQAKIEVCKYVHYGYGVPEGTGDISFVIEKGQQHMNGHVALQYARSRHQDDDYKRALRQQIVLQAVRNSVDPCTILPRIPSLITNLGQGFWTDLPISDAPAVAGLAQSITGGNLKTWSLAPARNDPGYYTNYLDSAKWARIKGIVAHGLDSAPAASGGSGSGSGGFHC